MSCITLAVGGDFCPIGRPESFLRAGALSPEEIVGFGRTLFTDCDVGIVNLECPLTERGEPIEKEGSALRGHPSTVRLLTHLGVKVVTAANNHIRDFGSAGLEDTLGLCTANGIEVVGAGADLHAACRPLYTQVKGRTVALVNAGEQEFADATANRAGAAPLDVIDLTRTISEARARAEHVVVILHGGLEYTHCPSPKSVKLLRFVAEQGVAAVVRHHTHFVQGWEFWKGVPVFYGLGNLLFDGDCKMSPDWFWGLVLRLHIAADNTCQVDLHPIGQCEHAPIMVLKEGSARAHALHQVADYSKLLADPAVLVAAWDAELLQRRASYYGGVLIPSYFILRVLRRLGLMRLVRPSAKFSRYLLNQLRCPAHREALIDLLSGDRDQFN